jgi:hypothetical protein
MNPMRLPAMLGAVSAIALLVTGAGAFADDHHGRDVDGRFGEPRTATPIKHLIVMFQENVSFDHYFATYPNAMNLTGETPFVAKRHTPVVNGLVTPLDVNHGFQPLAGVNLLNNNPNGNPAAPGNGKVESDPPVAGAGVDGGSGSQRKPRGKRLRQRQDGRLPGLGRHRGSSTRRHRQGDGDGLLRRQHHHGAVELRPELRDERQPLLDPVRALDSGRSQSDLGPDQRHCRHQERARRFGRAAALNA